jgi:predicted nucleic acid-binding Zn ribbon protein
VPDEVGSPEDYPQDAHSSNARISGTGGVPSPESQEFSTATRKRSTDPDPGWDRAGEKRAGDDPAGTEQAGTDLASAALQAARAIAAGRPAQAPRFRRRRRSEAAGGYSGAGPDSRDPAPIGAIVGQSIEQLGWTAPLSQGRLFGQWAGLVGSEIAARCEPVSLRDGELRITAESTAWATQLRRLAPQMLKRLCAELPPGTVTRLRITGPTAPSWKHGPWSMRGRGARDTYG